MPLSKLKLLSGLSESFGKEKAEEMINRVIMNAGLSLKDEYSKQEAFKICEQMAKSTENFIKIIGNAIKIQVMLMKE